MTRPRPDEAFRWSDESWGGALRCQPLEPVAQHLFTTRQLGLRGGPGHDDAWSAAVSAVGGLASRLARVKQVHGREVRIIGDERAADVSAVVPEADAVVASTAGVTLAVQVADCVPLLMADPRSGAAAAVHAGWRGTCAGVVQAAVDALARAYGTRASDLVAALGPSIGPCCYDVGDDVLAGFREAGATPAQIARWFAPSATAAWRLDLWTTNQEQLLAAGLRPDRIHLCRLCTKCHADLFDSYRVAGPNAGRMAALITVPDPVR